MKTKAKRILKTTLVVLAGILLAAVLFCVIWWSLFLNKNNLIKKYEAPAGQELYIMGTFHKDHFVKLFNYSFEDVLSAVQNIQPDIVFIEAREETFENYGAVDGPIDMSIVYSYCQNNNIPTEMIDWWVIDNDFKSNSTNEKRDDNIFSNIQNKLSEVESGKKVLVVCGAGHLFPQTKRFEKNGFTKQKIQSVSELFKSETDNFEYPDGVAEVWEQRSYFYAYTNPEIVEKDESLNDEVKLQYTSGNHNAFYNEQLHYCELFRNNTLYE